MSLNNPYLHKKKLSRRIVAIVSVAVLAIVAFFVWKNTTQTVDDSKLVGVRIAAAALGNPDKINAGLQAGGPLGYAIHTGVFQEELKKAGFRFDGIVGFPRTAAAILGMMSGQAELATTGDSPAVLSRARGEKTRALYVTNPKGIESSFWVVGRKGAPDTIQELGGHSVGLLFGSTFEYSFKAAATGLHLKDIAYTQLPTSAALPALQNDQLDAYVTSPNIAKLWVDKHGLKLIGKLGDIPSSGRIVSVITAREDFLAQNPTFAAAFWKGLKAAIVAIRKNPDAYYEWVADATGYSLDIVKATSDANFEESAISEEGVSALKALLAFRLSTDVAKADFSVDEWVLRQ